MDAAKVAGDDAEPPLALVGLALQVLLVPLLELDGDAGAVGRPLERSELALQARQGSCLAAPEGNQVNLRLLGAAPVGEERYLRAVGRPTRARVLLVAVGELARRPASRGHHPQVSVLALGLPVHALDAEHHVAAVGRNGGVGDVLNPVQVLGRYAPLSSRSGYHHVNSSLFDSRLGRPLSLDQGGAHHRNRLSRYANAVAVHAHSKLAASRRHLAGGKLGLAEALLPIRAERTVG